MASLFELRGERGLTQEAVASLAVMGRDTYNRVENGLQKPTATTVYRLAKVFDIEPGDIDFPQHSGGGPPEGAEIEAEEIVVTNERIVKKMESPPELTEAPQPEPEPEPESSQIVETTQTTTSRNTRVEANKVIKPEGNVGEVELGKAGIVGAALFSLDLFSGMSDKVALVLMVVVLLGIAFAIYHVEKSPAPKEEVKTSSGDPVRDYIAKYNK